MYGTFYTQSEYKALENKLKRSEAKVEKLTETVKSLKAELKRVKASADDLSSIVFDAPPSSPEAMSALDAIMATHPDNRNVIE